MKTDEMIGKRFGRLTVVRYAGQDAKWEHLFICQCDCGMQKTAKKKHLVGGHTKSCGCFFKEKSASNCRERTVHGHCKSSRQSPEYACWMAMKNRCLNSNVKAYPRYGGRGITVCDRWLESFENFLADMGERPEGASIDRIDNDGNYCPENCRWATLKQQARNKRSNTYLEHDGKRMCLVEWAKILKMPTSTLCNRLKRGWSVEDALTTPVKSR